GIGYGRPPSPSISRMVRSQLSLKPIPNWACTRRTSAPRIRLSRMLPTRSYTESGQSTQLSWIRTHFIPTRAAVAATWRVWLDWTPPMDTSVSHPCATASATRYSSLRTLLPPKASPLLQSSRFAQIRAPPRCALSRSKGCTGDGPNRSGYRANESRFIVTPADSGLDRGCRDVDDLVSLRLPACHPVAEA